MWAVLSIPDAFLFSRSPLQIWRTSSMRSGVIDPLCLPRPRCAVGNAVSSRGDALLEVIVGTA